MSEMIERVAKAIREELAESWPFTGHELLRDTARAAIEAMREPTDGMVGSGAVDYAATSDTRKVWRGMIDCALTDQPSELARIQHPK